MKTQLMIVLALSVTISFGQVPQKISYQGLLTTGTGTPVADGSYDLKFEIFNLPTGGTLRHTETQTGILIQRGTFSVILGSASPLTMSFNESLYVQVTVVAGPAGPSYPLTFSPRSELTSAPYSLQSVSLLGPNSIGSGIGATAGGSYNRARGSYSTVSGGGGATPADSNSARGDYATVGGGQGNAATGFANTVSGGRFNIASALVSTISGGESNIASGDKAAVGGGQENVASGNGAVIGGGQSNVANGVAATIPGGFLDSASGVGSFAAGMFAKARHNASFVWSDGFDFGSTASNQFLIHAGGGVGIGTTTPAYDLDVNGSVNATSILRNGAPLTHTVGESYGGGIVFYVDATGQHGLIAATADQSTGIPWYNGSYTTTNATRDGIGAGMYNTQLIISNQGAGSYAAKICADYQGGGYGDWYLPSKYELNLLYAQKAVVGGFALFPYWSSTELDGNYAWLQSFVNGAPFLDLKNYADNVRAVRAF